MEFITVIETATRILTILMFMTGIPPCISMYRSKDTSNVPYTLFLLGALGSTGMLHYGLMQDNSTLIMLNTIGSILNWGYVLAYVIVVKNKAEGFIGLTASLAYIVALNVYLYGVLASHSEIVDGLGKSAMLITAASLLIQCKDVVNNFVNKNCEGMPLVMTLGTLACQSCWLCYGSLLHDAYIYAPNIPGITLGLLRLLAASLYGGQQAKKDQEKKAS